MSQGIYAVLLFAVSSGLEDCEFRANVTDVEKLPNHKYRILENCLYYELSEKADEESKQFGSLMLLPPGSSSVKEEVTVTVKNLRFVRIWMSNEISKKMYISGESNWEWNDHRLRWSLDKWKMKEMKVEYESHIWVPDVGKMENDLRDFFPVDYRDIRVSSTGHITSRIVFNVDTVCQMDYTDFPNDKAHCCFDFESRFYRDMIRYDVGSVKKEPLDEELVSTWEMEEPSVEVADSVLKICVSGGRRSKTLKMELTLPMAVSAVVVLVAPLFGSFTNQNFAKVFSLLLQIICFHFLVYRTPQLGFGGVVPKIYRFYEFSVIMTIVSLLMTLVLGGLSRQERKLPPPHALVLVASSANALLCCSEKKASSTENPESGAPSSHKSEWSQIYLAANNILSLCFMVAYIIGLLALCT